MDEFLRLLLNPKKSAHKTPHNLKKVRSCLFGLLLNKSARQQPNCSRRAYAAVLLALALGEMRGSSLGATKNYMTAPPNLTKWRPGVGSIYLAEAYKTANSEVFFALATIGWIFDPPKRPHRVLEGSTESRPHEGRRQLPMA